MAHDVFISYSSKDKTTADQTCAALEEKGIRCWMAPRDIRPGADWSESVIDAINGAKTFVMVFSSSANDSRQIKREVQHAFDHEIPVIPLRIENVMPAKSLQYYLSTPHWLDAYTPPLREHLSYLADVIRSVIDGSPAPEPLKLPSSKPTRRILIGGGVAAAALAGAGTWALIRSSGTTPLIFRPSALFKPSGVSVAVLPLRNLSDDRQQGYFSDGQTEAIATALANVKGLTVVGQQSVYSLDPKNADYLKTAGRTLSADYLIDGSVRWATDEVSVDANLLKVGADSYLSRQSYRDSVDNVLKTQENIAQLVVTDVCKKLGLAAASDQTGSGQSLIVDNADYNDYREAKRLVRARAAREPGGPLTQAAKILENVVRRDPDYFWALALLVPVYGFIATFHSLFFTGSDAELKAFYDIWIPKAEDAAQKAMTRAMVLSARSDTKNLSLILATAHTSMGLVQNFRSQFGLAEASYKKALEFEPNHTDALHLYSLMLLCVGRIKEAAELRSRLQKLEPLVLVYSAFNTTTSWLRGDDERALKVLNTVPPAAAAHPYVARQLALIYGSQGKKTEAATALAKAARAYDPATVEAAVKFMSGGAVPNIPLRFFDPLHVFSASPERALDYLEANLKAGMWPATETPSFWHPSKPFAALRNTKRFQDLMQKSGVVAYWREYGWPDGLLCRSLGANNFTCE